MIVKLLTEHHLEFLSLKGGCTGSSESTLVKMFIVGNHLTGLNYELCHLYLSTSVKPLDNMYLVILQLVRPYAVRSNL